MLGDKLTRSPAIAKVGKTVPPISEAIVRLPVAERKRFSRVTAVPYTLWWRCYIERYN